MKIIRTILRDIKPEELGNFNYHEHAFQCTPLLPNEDLDDFEKSQKEFRELKESGFNGYLEATPYGLGRRPDLVAKIAQSTGLNIVHTTGFHKLEHYSDQPEILGFNVEDKINLIISEITKGFNNTNIKAGVIKTGVGEKVLSEFEKSSIQAAAYVNREIGTAIMVHLDKKSNAELVLDLFEENEVELSRVCLAHADAKVDPNELKNLLARGVYLGFDRAARLNEIAELGNLKLFAELVDAGFCGQILFGGDLARRTRYEAYGGKPGLRFLNEVYLPKLQAVTSESQIRQILNENPATWLAFTP
ncbi:MAG: phosphotriesterase family protein [Candidatus Nanopelagicales bacterium]